MYIILFGQKSKGKAKMSEVFDEYEECLGRTLTKDEYDNITADELRDAIHHSPWGICVFDTDNDIRFTKEVVDDLRRMSATELKEVIQKEKGMIIRYSDDDEPGERIVFPVFQKGPRKGYSNFKKEPEVFFDRWYTIEFVNEC